MEHVPDTLAGVGDDGEEEEEDAGGADADALDQVLRVTHVLVVPLLRLLQDHRLQAYYDCYV